jgi:hypothetical protein
VNPGVNPIEVQMRLLDNSGNQVTTATPTIQPGHGSSVTSSLTGGFGQFRSCTFVFKGGKTAVRAGMEMILGTGGNIQVDAR